MKIDRKEINVYVDGSPAGKTEIWTINMTAVPDKQLYLM